MRFDLAGRGLYSARVFALNGDACLKNDRGSPIG